MTAATLTLRDVALNYGTLLLRDIRIAGTLGRWATVNDRCDRFENLMANLPPVSQPLVWEGDYS